MSSIRRSKYFKPGAIAAGTLGGALIGRSLYGRKRFDYKFGQLEQAHQGLVSFPEQATTAWHRYKVRKESDAVRQERSSAQWRGLQTGALVGMVVSTAAAQLLQLQHPLRHGATPVKRRPRRQRKRR